MAGAFRSRVASAEGEESAAKEEVDRGGGRRGSMRVRGGGGGGVCLTLLLSYYGGALSAAPPRFSDVPFKRGALFAKSFPIFQGGGRSPLWGVFFFSKICSSSRRRMRDGARL